MSTPATSRAESSASPPAARDTHNGEDLEKQKTAPDVPNGNSPIPQRVSRINSLTRRARLIFTRPLTHQKTSEEQIVDFDGLDDPYRPQNWPFRKKVLTTLLYGL